MPAFRVLLALTLVGALLPTTCRAQTARPPPKPRPSICWQPCNSHAQRNCPMGWFCRACPNCADFACPCLSYSRAVGFQNSQACNYSSAYRTTESTPSAPGECAWLTECGVGTYVAVNATETTDRVCANAVNCTGSTPYQDSPPTPTTGRTCTPSAGSACVAGVSWASSLATPTSSCSCTNVTDCFVSGTWASTIATTTSNAVCTPFSNCLANGTFSTAPATPTTDVVCSTPLTQCTVGTNFQSQGPTITSDRRCLNNVTDCVAVNNTWSLVLPTPSSNVACLQFVQNCSLQRPVQIGAPTYTSDRGCAARCNASSYAAPAEPPGTSSGICTALSTCGAQLETVTPTLTTDRQCGDACSPDEFVGPAAPSGTSSGVCTPVTACSGGFYETRAPTATSNRDCSRYTNCTAIGFWSTAPAVATADVVCNEKLRVCTPPSVQTTAPTITTDRQCTPVAVSRSSKLPSSVIGGISVGAVVLVMVVVVSGVFLWRRQHKQIVVRHTFELDQLMDRDAEREATVQRLLSAWQIPEAHLTFDTVLAEGAYGTVWKGLWGSQPVAIKVLKSSNMDVESEAVQEEFGKECETLQAIKHPNLLVFFGAGTTENGNNFFMVTELMHGGSVRKALEDPLRVYEWTKRVRIASQIASGMEHLHKLEIVHRDLKSDNCLLDSSDNAKVADFGTSKILTSSRKASAEKAAPVSSDSLQGTLSMTRAVGTLFWMAPEVFFGTTGYTASVDVYSFAIIMWELATRKMPWGELGVTSYIDQFRKLDEALRAGQRPTLPDNFDAEHADYSALLRACWATDAESRPTFAKIVTTFKTMAPAERPQRSLDAASRSLIVQAQARTTNAADDFKFKSVGARKVAASTHANSSFDPFGTLAAAARVQRSPNADATSGPATIYE